MRIVIPLILALTCACVSKEYDQARKTFCAATEAALSEGELYYLADLKDGIPNAGPYTDGRGTYAIVVGMSGAAERVAALISLEAKPDLSVGDCFAVARIGNGRRWLKAKCPEPQDPMIYLPLP